MLSERAIAARRANWRKWRGVSPEGRERQRRACRRDRPWLRSTGPRTPVGKQLSRSNAILAGDRCDKLDPNSLMLQTLAAAKILEAKILLDARANEQLNA